MKVRTDSSGVEHANSTGSIQMSRRLGGHAELRQQRRAASPLGNRPEVAVREAKDVHSLLLTIRVNCRAHMSFFSEVQLEDEFGPFVAFQEALGFIPNLLRAQTLLPRVIEAQAKLESAVRLQEGAISRMQKERILLSIAVDRQDAYCITLDSKVLSSLGASESHIDDRLERPS